MLQEEKSESEYKETVKSVIRTYSNATLTNTERIVIENEPDARVFRYMKRSEIDKIFKARKNKILEYLANAETAEEHLQIADALRYYYWSQTLLRSHPEGATIRYRDKDGEERLAGDLDTVENQHSFFSFEYYCFPGGAGRKFSDGRVNYFIQSTACAEF